MSLPMILFLRPHAHWLRFLEDIFVKGEVGGHCRFDSELHGRQGEHKSPLQSWFAELGQYSALKFKPTSDQYCDEIVTKPTVFIKLDAGTRLYCHFKLITNAIFS